MMKKSDYFHVGKLRGIDSQCPTACKKGFYYNRGGIGYSPPMWPLKEPMVVDLQQMPDALLLLQPEILIAAERMLLTPIEKHQRAKSTFADRDQPAPSMSLLAVSRHDQ